MIYWLAIDRGTLEPSYLFDPTGGIVWCIRDVELKKFHTSLSLEGWKSSYSDSITILPPMKYYHNYQRNYGYRSLLYH